MPVVLVHGVPDTHRVWRALTERLCRKDVITLSPPGFGCAVPTRRRRSGKHPASASRRSAVAVGLEWVDDLRRVQAPGLMLWGQKDPYAAPLYGSRLAGRTRARFVEFPGYSHWWQLERAADVARELEAFWETA